MRHMLVNILLIIASVAVAFIVVYVTLHHTVLRPPTPRPPAQVRTWS